MDAGGGVGRAGAAGDEGDSGAPGHLAVGVGHIGDPAFLPADDNFDLGRVMKRVEHREEAFAGNGEHTVAALDAKLVDKNLAAGAEGACICRHFGFIALVDHIGEKVQQNAHD